MAESPSTALQRALREQLVAMLGRVRDAAEAVGALAGLGPAGPEWAGTALDGHLLAPLADLDPPDPFVGIVFRALRRVTGGAADSVAIALHGWQEADGAPRGIAYAGRVAAAGGTLAFAVHVTPSDAGPVLGVTVSGAAAAPVSAALGGSWSITISGAVAGALRLTVDPRTGAVGVQQSTDGDRIEAELHRTDDRQVLGVPGGPSVVLGPVVLGGRLQLRGGSLDRTGWVRLPGATAQLAPAALAGLAPRLEPVRLPVDLGAGETGLTLGGSTELAVRVPVALSAPGIAVESADLVLRPVPVPGAAVGLAIGLRIAAKLTVAGSPLTLRMLGLGLEVPIAIGDAPVRGIDPTGIATLPMTGAGVDVALPIVSAGGFLAQGRPGEYAGALSAAVPPMSAAAFAVLGTQPLSFVVLLSATFPPPGIQVGFGFAVSGVGGVVGVGRRLDREALLRAVTDGTAAALLFPPDPAAAAGQVGGALAGLFPPARGAVFAGPMFQLSWGGRIATASIAVIVEVAPTPRLTIIGRLTVALPDPAAPLILIQATFAGMFDLSEPSTLLVASLVGSHVLGRPVTGDVCFLTRGGADATFVLSAGGFHPAFPLPRGVPPLARIGMDLSPLPLLELRAEAYLAVTSNTIQFGARIELVAEVAGCGLRGHLALDVLIQREPLRFVASVSIGIALTVFGEELVGIALDLTLEGPTPWRARGRGSIDLFLFEVSFDFDLQWGEDRAVGHAAPDVGGLLAAALRAPSAWTVHRSARGLPGLVLTPDADRALGRGELVAPYGSLTVRQRAVPLGIAIDRVDRLPLPGRQTWDIVGGTLGAGAVPVQSAGELREPFAAAAFLALSDDDQLGRPAYESFRAGLDLVPAGVVVDPLTTHPIEPETRLIADPLLPSVAVLLEDVTAFEVVVAAAASGPTDPHWWPAATEVVSVAARPPLAVAGSWAMTPQPMATLAGPDVGAGFGLAAEVTTTELLQVMEAAGRHDLMVVEAWELG